MSNPTTTDFVGTLRAAENKMCWHINDLCNFKCEYCFFPYFDKENPDVGKLSPQEILNALNATNRKWHLFIAGGEPLLYPNFAELVTTLKPHHPIQISTNLYNKKVKDFASAVTPDGIIIINASLHIGHHNEKSLLQFIKNYHMFREKGFPIMVSYVTYPPLLERMKNDFRFLHEQGIETVVPLTYHGTYEGKHYPESYTQREVSLIKDVIDKYPLEVLNTTDSMKFKDMLCRAGKDFFYMNITGDLFTCGTILKPMGNLFDGTFRPNEKPMRCSAHRCNDNWLGILSLVKEPKVSALQINPLRYITTQLNGLHSAMMKGTRFSRG
jgi:MoaA/NifB/PqqE/SkfB family radical SAM enzyme